MKILLLNFYYAPDEAATAQMLSDLGEALAAAGHDVTAICGDRAYGDPNRRYPKRATIGGVKIRRVASSGFGRGHRLGRVFDYFTYFTGAAVHVFTRRYDVIVFLSTPPLIGVLGIAGARFRRARAIFWSMDVYPDLAFALGAIRQTSLSSRLLTRLSRFVLRNADMVVALGATMANKLEEQASPRPELPHPVPLPPGEGGRRPGEGTLAPRITFIHNWADGEAIRPRPIEAHSLRRSWGWERRFVVLYSGNLGLAHDFETILAAAALLRSRAEILFAFVGGGPMLPHVRRESAERRLANVEIRDPILRQDLGESLTAGDVHLVTLRAGMEGLLVPSKIYGILAAGRPTIYVGPEGGEVHEIVTRGKCGVAVRNGGAHELAAEIEAYAVDSERRQREGVNARALFEREFTKEKALGEWMGVIEGEKVIVAGVESPSETNVR